MRYIIILLFLSLQISSQSIDSTIHEIKDKTIKEQLEILSKECWTYRSKNPTYAMSCGEKGIELAKRIKDKTTLAQLKNYIGVINRNIGKYTEALKFYNEALEIAKEINDSVQIAYSYNNIGGAYRLELNYTLALENMFKALDIFEELKMKEGRAFSMINIGLVYSKQENYEKAIEYFNQTLDIRKELGDKFGQALTLNQIAEVYFNQGKLDLALQKYQELLELYEDLDDTKGIAVVIGGIGGIKFRQGDLVEARNYRQDALYLNRQIDNIEGVVNNLHELALIYLELEQNSDAKDALDESYALTKKYNNVALLIDHYRYRSEYFRRIGELQEALDYFKLHSHLKDSLATELNIESIASMEALHKVNLANKENALLMKENQLRSRQNTFLLIISILLVLIIAYGIYKYNQNKKLNKKLEELNATKDKFFSIVAHDLKNPFNNLLGYTEILYQDFDEMTDEEKKTAIMDIHNSSKKLLSLVENLLDWSRANIGSLKYNPTYVNVHEIFQDAAALYSNITKTKNIALKIDIPENLKVYTDPDYLLLVSRNLLSNAVKFSNAGGEIHITYSENENYFQFDFIDEGIGMSDESVNNLFKLAIAESTRGTSNESGSGLGLILVSELVKKWGGQIKVESKLNKGSKFSVTVPKRESS